MSSELEQIEETIKISISKGFRGRLLDRGLARSMIWSGGLLPEGAPEFAVELSYDLLSYGYSLLSLGIKLKELKGSEELYRSAFENSAIAISDVIINGDTQNPINKFHNLLAACAYHLGLFSAKAFSLLQKGLKNESMNINEEILTLLILRRFEDLERIILDWKASGQGADDSLANMIDEIFDDYGDDGKSVNHGINEINIIELALNDNYVTSIYKFILALETGDEDFLKQSIEILETCISASSELCLIQQWWVSRITKFLISELWDSSFHKIIPKLSVEKSSTDWMDLRWQFIVSLLKRERAEIELWPSQLEGGKRSVNNDDDLVISLPTSAGKTRIAELCILRCLSLGKRVLFITPLRALSAQTEISLRKTFHPLGKSVTSLYGSIGASNFEKDILKSKDIVVGTPEKLDFALRNDSTILNDIGLVVLDEGHMIGLNEREINYEVQIQRLLRREDSDERRIVCLSAILPDGDELEDFVNWLRRDKDGEAIKSDWRPTDIRYGEINWFGDSGRLDFSIGDEKPFIPNFILPIVPSKPYPGVRRTPFPKNNHELTLAAAWKLVQDNHTVLIYCTQKDSVNAFANSIIDLHKRGALNSVLSINDSQLDLAKVLGDEWLGKHHPIVECLDLGVGIHHGSLPTPYRKEIERLLRKGVLKITVSSPTLAQGLNLTATAIIVYSLYRSGVRIDVTEFKNVVGRAGRAFIDTHGLVLHPIFDNHSWKKGKWYEIIEDSKAREMQSGLVKLVHSILNQIYSIFHEDDISILLEYILNNSKTWDFPELENEDDATRDERSNEWFKNIQNLDTALLSLLGEYSDSDENISELLQDSLKDSLWNRSIARFDSKEISELFNVTLIQRARYIFSETSKKDRQAYFLAGVGLETGKYLDSISSITNDLLVKANGHILNSDFDSAIEEIIKLAELIFKTQTFKPNIIPIYWRELIKIWLKGETLSENESFDINDSLRFIEDGLIYRLPWGIEAIKVRAQAHQDLIDDISIDSFELDLVVPAIENGTLNRSSALLMQAGFNSRKAAIYAVESTSASFENARQLKQWLNSEEIKALAKDNNWPTSETHKMWELFLNDFQLNRSIKWSSTNSVLEVEWISSYKPTASEILKLNKASDGLIQVYNSQGSQIGHLSKEYKIPQKGIYFLKASDDNSKISADYFGPEIDVFSY